MKSLLASALFALLALATTASAQDKVALTATVEKALKGYNADDAKATFADYTPTMSSLATPDGFKIIFGPAKAKLGKFESMKIIDAETSINPDAPLVVYKGKFEKGEAKVAVNFIKEGAEYKVMQITIQP